MERDFLGLNWKGSSETASSYSVVGDSKIEAYCQKDVSSVPHLIPYNSNAGKRVDDFQSKNVAQPHDSFKLPSPTFFHPPPNYYAPTSKPCPFIPKNNIHDMTWNSFPPTVDYASSSPRDNQPMTIFYGNEVHVYNEVSPQLAREIVTVAKSGDREGITDRKHAAKLINVDEARSKKSSAYRKQGIASSRQY